MGSKFHMEMQNGRNIKPILSSRNPAGAFENQDTITTVSAVWTWHRVWQTDHQAAQKQAHKAWQAGLWQRRPQSSGGALRVLLDEGEQRCPQNRPRWHKAYVELKTLEEQQIPEELPALPACLEAGHTFTKVSPCSLHEKGQKPVTRDTESVISQKDLHSKPCGNQPVTPPASIHFPPHKRPRWKLKSPFQTYCSFVNMLSELYFCASPSVGKMHMLINFCLCFSC